MPPGSHGYFILTYGVTMTTTLRLPFLSCYAYINHTLTSLGRHDYHVIGTSLGFMTTTTLVSVNLTLSYHGYYTTYTYNHD